MVSTLEFFRVSRFKFDLKRYKRADRKQAYRWNIFFCTSSWRCALAYFLAVFVMAPRWNVFGVRECPFWPEASSCKCNEREICSIPEANRGSFEGKEIVVLGTFETQCFVELISSKFEIRVILNVITASRILNVGWIIDCIIDCLRRLSWFVGYK